MRQYEMLELKFRGQPPEDSHVEIDLTADFDDGCGCLRVKGFYAGRGNYAVRFLPNHAGKYHYRVSGCITAEGTIDVDPADKIHHGLVHAQGTHFTYEDGNLFHPFGTTVYALVHQPEHLIRLTMDTLRNAPFNKVRMCIFPKDYDYNKNDPAYYPFEKTADGHWNVHHPCFQWWDALENCLSELEQMQIQVDLILFHPYDRWGFDTMAQEDNLVYLKYLLRRLSAFPNIWWSLANEYDLSSKSIEQWEELEAFVAGNDVFHHLLSCHNCFKFWDFSHQNITHASIQSKLFYKLNTWRENYKKPVVLDECCYEGDLPHFWGSISGKEMTRRFWKTVVTGAYCTHGETFLDRDAEVIWWSKGGILKGESPTRIAFLRSIIESLPGHLEGVQTYLEKMAVLPSDMRTDTSPALASFWKLEAEMEAFAGAETIYQGKIGDICYLTYYDNRTCAEDTLYLPETRTYRIELIDTWNMTREVFAERASGTVKVHLPGREYMAVLAIAEDAAVFIKQ